MVRVAQTQGNTEVILFNDCSPDDSQSIIDEYASRYPGIIRPMKSEKNLGVGNARTTMCRQARGRYILSFDQDDIMLPFDLGGVISMMDNNPRYGASYSKKYLFDESGLTGEVHGGSPSDFNAFFAPKININAMVIRAEILASHDYFKPVPNSAINDDVFLMIRLGADCDYHYDADNPRVLYRMHDRQNSRLFHHEDQRPFFWMAEYMTKQHPELYKRILANDPPPVTPENRKLVLALMGAAVFLNQKRFDVVFPIISRAREIAPDDYGVWEHTMLVLATRDKNDEIMKTCEAARERFKNDPPDKELAFLYALKRYYSVYGRKFPKKFDQQIEKLNKVFAKPPAIVLENLPKQ